VVVSSYPPKPPRAVCEKLPAAWLARTAEREMVPNARRMSDGLNAHGLENRREIGVAIVDTHAADNVAFSTKQRSDYRSNVSGRPTTIVVSSNRSPPSRTGLAPCTGR
jgi:hypothetical protein